MGEPKPDAASGYTCQEVVALASEYLERARTPDQTTLFELHLNFCDGCSSFVDQLRTTSTMAHGIAVDQIPEEMQSKLLAAFRDWRQ